MHKDLPANVASLDWTKKKKYVLEHSLHKFVQISTPKKNPTAHLVGHVVSFQSGLRSGVFFLCILNIFHVG